MTLQSIMFEKLEGRRFLAVTVAIDGSVRHQTMDGFGSSERVFDDPHVFENFNPATGRAATVLTTAQQDEVLDRLYRELGLTRLRPATPDTAVGAGIEPSNDNTDPNATDLSKFNFNWKNLDAHVDYIARARARGVTTSFLSPLSRESWMGTSTPTDVAEYGEWLMAQVRRAAELGVRLPYLSVANEPSYSRNTLSGQFIRDVIKNVGPRLRAEGFDTMFVTPDDVRASNAAAKASVVLADPVARQYVGALATHLYDESVSNVGQLKSLATQYGLPLWMTEFSLSGMGSAGRPADPFAWASLMHELISSYDVSAVDYMWGFFGEWEGSSSMLITLNHTGSTYDGYTLNKTYYTTGQFSRFVEPGAERIRAQSSDPAVQTTSFVNDDGEVVIVAVNAGSSNQQVTFNLSGTPAVARFAGVRTSASENWAAVAPISVQGSAFSAVLPHNSVTTFTGGAAAAVVDRRVFYNNSAFDGSSAAANAADDAAIAADKVALLPGGTATFANYTSYSKGLNGIMIDVRDLAVPENVGADDVLVYVGNSPDPAAWAAGPAPSIAKRALDNGVTRITLTWPDNAIQKQWAQIRVLGNADTGLGAPDVFYFGNAVGESGNSASDAVINGTDFAGARDNQRGSQNLAPITWRWDYNRDRLVNGTDLAIARDNVTSSSSSLKLITTPAAFAEQVTRLATPAPPTSAGVVEPIAPGAGAQSATQTHGPVAARLESTLSRALRRRV